jgi:segregation and condensation protein B
MTRRSKKDVGAVEAADPADEITKTGEEDRSFDDDDEADTQVGPAPDLDMRALEMQTDVPTVDGQPVAGQTVAPAGAEAEIAEPAASGEPAGDVEPGGDVDGPPPAPSLGRLESIIESLLFASDRPLPLSDLKRLLGERDGGKITAVLEELQARRQDSGIQLAQVAGGWQLRTHPENVPWVSRILSGKPPRLSRAMLEALAIIAYRQPITRPEVDEIRGVDCGPVLKTLLDRGLVRMIGKKEEVGRPILYGTTAEFLRTFSLRDLSELPTLREFHELGAAELAKVAAATPAADPRAGAERPPAPSIREPDPGEEERLLSDLESASAAAMMATAAGTTESSATSATSGGAGPEGTAD